MPLCHTVYFIVNQNFRTGKLQITYDAKVKEVKGIATQFVDHRASFFDTMYPEILPEITQQPLTAN